MPLEVARWKASEKRERQYEIVWEDQVRPEAVEIARIREKSVRKPREPMVPVESMGSGVKRREGSSRPVIPK